MHEKAIVQKPPRGPAKRTRHATKQAALGDWETVLLRRRRIHLELNSKKAEKYARRVTADRNKAKQKFFLKNDLESMELDDVESNDAGLPAPAHSERARLVEDWCKLGSWGTCVDCGSTNPRRLEPIVTRRVAKAEMTKRACENCCNGTVKIPTYDDVQEELRDLSVTVVEALRPLELDMGPYKRAPCGHWTHSAMVRFLWSEQSVKSKIDELPTEHKKPAQKAFAT